MREARFVHPRLIPALCIVALVAAFVVDMMTPQLLVAAILLDAPIVLSSLGGSRRFTYGLVAAALIANATAGYFNGLADDAHWDSIGIGDRFLAGLSIVFVGYLSTAVHQNAQRAGLLEGQQRRSRREADLAGATERVRRSLSTDLVLRAIVREATTLFGVSEARLVLANERALTFVAHVDNTSIDVDETRPAPEVASLVQRTLDLADIVSIESSDALGRLILGRLEAGAALALPIVDRDRRFGVLLVLGTSAEDFTDRMSVARAFAQQAANALAQARLFEELAERNSALEERSAVIRDLVYALSHDLRTPLAALSMTMQQARDGAYGDLPERYRTVLGHSITATDDVARLAETLLLVARFESGDRRPERERVDARALIDQIAAELAALANDRSVSLSALEGGPIEVIGDRADLRRAITNLVANAIEHTPAAGHVTLEALHSDDGLVHVIVSDDGYGVAEPMRTRLFTRFARIDGRRGGGTGLGLYIVRRVAQESGGEVRFEPREPRGSRFVLDLPGAP